MRSGFAVKCQTLMVRGAASGRVSGRCFASPGEPSKAEPPPAVARAQAKGRQVALPPSKSSREETYFRLLIAVRSNDSLAMPVAPHQLEPTPDGLIGVRKVPLEAVRLPRAAKSLVKALQSPLERLVSE